MVSFDAHLDWSLMSPGFEAWRDKLGRELDLGRGSRWLSFQRYVWRCFFINTSSEKTGWLGWFIEGGWLDCCCFIDHSWESDSFKTSRMSWKLMVSHFPLRSPSPPYHPLAKQVIGQARLEIGYGLGGSDELNQENCPIWYALCHNFHIWIYGPWLYATICSFSFGDKIIFYFSLPSTFSTFSTCDLLRFPSCPFRFGTASTHSLSRGADGEQKAYLEHQLLWHSTVATGRRTVSSAGFLVQELQKAAKEIQSLAVIPRKRWYFLDKRHDEDLSRLRDSQLLKGSLKPYLRNESSFESNPILGKMDKKSKKWTKIQKMGQKSHIHHWTTKTSYVFFFISNKSLPITEAVGGGGFLEEAVGFGQAWPEDLAVFGKSATSRRGHLVGPNFFSPWK